MGLQHLFIYNLFHDLFKAGTYGWHKENGNNEEMSVNQHILYTEHIINLDKITKIPSYYS